MTGSIEGGPRRIDVDEVASRAAARSWWDAEADAYQGEHQEQLGQAQWLWGPEGWTDDDLDLLGVEAGDRLLELGCGAGAGARGLIRRGVAAVGLDLSHRMLQHSRRIDEVERISVPVVEATAEVLPFRSGVFSVVASSYGALPFVAGVDQVFAEIHRVLAPGGRAVIAVTHPMRWAFLDDPSAGGLTAVRPYFDRTPYAEVDDEGTVVYVEHHRTVGDWVTAVVGAGFVIDQLVEPPWNPDNPRIWGGWSPLRGSLIPGTLILAAHKPAECQAG
ncbi:MAG: class I SAM-dependent methyltransferase [Actinomycetes bacterium]